MEQYLNAIEQHVDGNKYWLVYVTQHKTVASHGPAQLVISDEMKPLYDNFLTVREGRGSSEAFFVNHAGIKPSRLPNVVQAFASSHGCYSAQSNSSQESDKHQGLYAADGRPGTARFLYEALPGYSAKILQKP